MAVRISGSGGPIAALALCLASGVTAATLAPGRDANAQLAPAQPLRAGGQLASFRSDAGFLAFLQKRRDALRRRDEAAGQCQGGAAPHAFGQAYVAPGLSDDPEHDIRRALEAWVEQGKVPERIVEAAQVLHTYHKGER